MSCTPEEDDYESDEELDLGEFGELDITVLLEMCSEFQ